MKVLYLINYAGKAGTEKYVLNLIKAYNQKKCQCFLAYNEEGPLADEVRKLNVKTFKLKMTSPFDISAAKNLAKITKENKIDVIHAQYPRENYIAILSKLFYKDVKVIFTSHLIMENNFIWKITNRLFTPFNHRIIAVCTYGKELLIKNGLPKNKIDVIFNAMTVSDKKINSSIREEFNLKDEFIIVTLARYHETKGLPFLIDSIAELKKIAVRPFKLLLVGDGSLWDDITKRIDERDVKDLVIRPGFRTDTENILAGSDLFVNSARSEALSFAMLEALANKLPIVATDVGGNPDICGSDTGCGLLVPYLDTKKMAEALNKIMSDDDLRNKMKENALKTVKTKFDYENMINRTFSTYK